jgi:predicted transcriptional regulator
MNLRSNRAELGVSQSRLARLSGVSRFRICLFELGDAPLTVEEQARIIEALRTETDRLRNVAIQVDFDTTPPETANGSRP